MALLEAIKESLQEKTKLGLDWNELDKISIQNCDSLKTLYDLYAKFDDTKKFSDDYKFICLFIAREIAKNAYEAFYFSESVSVDVAALAIEILLQDNCIQNLSFEEIKSIIDSQWHKVSLINAKDNLAGDADVAFGENLAENKTRILFSLVDKILHDRTGLAAKNLSKLQYVIATQTNFLKYLYEFGYSLSKGWVFVSIKELGEAITTYQRDFFVQDLCKLFNQTITKEDLKAIVESFSDQCDLYLLSCVLEAYIRINQDNTGIFFGYFKILQSLSVEEQTRTLREFIRKLDWIDGYSLLQFYMELNNYLFTIKYSEIGKVTGLVQVALQQALIVKGPLLLRLRLVARLNKGERWHLLQNKNVILDFTIKAYLCLHFIKHGCVDISEVEKNSTWPSVQVLMESYKQAFDKISNDVERAIIKKNFICLPKALSNLSWLGSKLAMQLWLIMLNWSAFDAPLEVQEKYIEVFVKVLLHKNPPPDLFAKISSSLISWLENIYSQDNLQVYFDHEGHYPVCENLKPLSLIVIYICEKVKSSSRLFQEVVEKLCLTHSVAIAMFLGEYFVQRERIAQQYLVDRLIGMVGAKRGTAAPINFVKVYNQTIRDAFFNKGNPLINLFSLIIPTQKLWEYYNGHMPDMAQEALLLAFLLWFKNHKRPSDLDRNDKKLITSILQVESVPNNNYLQYLRVYFDLVIYGENASIWQKLSQDLQNAIYVFFLEREVGVLRLVDEVFLEQLLERNKNLAMSNAGVRGYMEIMRFDNISEKMRLILCEQLVSNVQAYNIIRQDIFSNNSWKRQHSLDILVAIIKYDRSKFANVSAILQWFLIFWQKKARYKANDDKLRLDVQKDIGEAIKVCYQVRYGSLGRLLYVLNFIWLRLFNEKSIVKSLKILMNQRKYVVKEEIKALVERLAADVSIYEAPITTTVSIHAKLSRKK